MTKVSDDDLAVVCLALSASTDPPDMVKLTMDAFRRIEGELRALRDVAAAARAYIREYDTLPSDVDPNPSVLLSALDGAGVDMRE